MHNASSYNIVIKKIGMVLENTYIVLLTKIYCLLISMFPFKTINYYFFNNQKSN